jgi:hypothetical protein
VGATASSRRFSIVGPARPTPPGSSASPIGTGAKRGPTRSAADGERRAARPNVRQRALRLLGQGKSSTQVAEELGVPAGTVRYWRHAAGHAGPPSGADPISWAERKRKSAEGAHGVAVQALVEVRNLPSAGRVREAKDAALTFAILSDKSGVLEQAAERAAEQQVGLAQAHPEQLVEVVCAFLDALGVPFTDRGPARRLLAGLLRQAGEGAPLAPSPADAKPARQELLEALTVELRERMETAAPAPEPRHQQPLLPAPPPPHPDGADAERAVRRREAAGRDQIAEAERTGQEPRAPIGARRSLRLRPGLDLPIRTRRREDVVEALRQPNRTFARPHGSAEPRPLLRTLIGGTVAPPPARGSSQPSPSTRPFWPNGPCGAWRTARCRRGQSLMAFSSAWDSSACPA